MVCVEGLTRGLDLAAVNTVSRAAASGPAQAIVLPDGKKTPYNLITTIDPLDAGDQRLGRARVRGLRRTGLAATRMGRLFGHRWLLRYRHALKNAICVHPARTHSGVPDHRQEPARDEANPTVVVKVGGGAG